MFPNDPLRLPPFHFDADPDPDFHIDADSDSVLELASRNDWGPTGRVLYWGNVRTNAVFLIQIQDFDDICSQIFIVKKKVSVKKCNNIIPMPL
jgi:hypothetical protein